MNRISLCFLLLASIQTYTLRAQEGLAERPATVYFYRVSSSSNADLSITLHDNDSILGDLKSASIITYFCPPGQHEFWGKTTTRRSIFLDVKPGKVYTIRCGISNDGAPTFHQTAKQTAADQMRTINAASDSSSNKVSKYNRPSRPTPYRPSPVTPSANKPEDIKIAAKTDISPQSDTITALTRLYARKRTGGKIRTYIFAYFAGSALVTTLASGDASNLVAVALFGGIAATGRTQVSRYSKQNLQTLVLTYQAGFPLSRKIKRKLKDKDFRPLTETQRKKMTYTN